VRAAGGRRVRVAGRRQVQRTALPSSTRPLTRILASESFASLLVVFCACRDPPFDDGYLSGREVGPAGARHPFTDDAGCTFEFLDDVTVVGIVRDDADGAGLGATADVHQVRIRDVMPQIQSAARRSAA